MELVFLTGLMVGATPALYLGFTWGIEYEKWEFEKGEQ